MLKEILEEKGVSVYKLSKETGIAYSSLNDIVIEKTDIKNVSANMLYRLSKYLDLSMEQLYENSYKPIINIFLSNVGRNIVIQFNTNRIQYLGPKNLVGFHRVNTIKNGVLYVECYFEDENGVIYEEEDYVDLNDILKDYNEVLNREYRVVIGEPNTSKRDRVVNEALLVSDNIAILNYSDNSIPDKLVQTVSVARPNSKSIIRLKDLSVVSSNMSKSLLRRSLDALKRNMEEIEYEIEGISKYA